MSKKDQVGWVAVESDIETSATQIKPPGSAYQFFQKHSIETGYATDLDFGERQKAIAAEWRSLDEERKSFFASLASKDRMRFDAECSLRDSEVLAEQERRRKAREAPVEGPRVAAKPVSEPLPTRTPRTLSSAEIAAKESAIAAKSKKQSEIKKQKDAVDSALAIQAQKRLQYLLSQSDVFASFGVKPKNDVASCSSSCVGAPSPSKRRERCTPEADGNEDEAEGMAVTRLLQQPSCIKFGKMRPYQLEGLNWMIKLQENGVNGILADEMGLGKTLQSISILGFMLEYRGVSGPHLVLVPKSTLANWMNEFERWCPSLRAVRFHGDKNHRQDMVRTVLKPGVSQEERDWDVLVTTYEVANMEVAALSKFAWRYLIIDEAHRIKNETSKFSCTIRTLKTEHRLLITGTPLQNNLHELWALLNFLLPDIFDDAESFDCLFDLQIDDAEAKKSMIGMLHKILRPFMLRRLKADVETSLPPKSEMMIFTGMSSMQRDLYKKILRRELDTVNGDAATSRAGLLNIVMQLRKACNHPYLFDGLEDRRLDPLGEHLVTNCGKMILLDKLLSALKARGHRVLLFSQMTRMLDIIEDFTLMRGYEYCRIDGDTSYEEREELIDAYNAPQSSKFIFLLSTRAGGLGINLQTADTVVLFDSDWNPQSDLQAQDRAHRIGQKKVVNVYRLVTESTIEEKVVMRAQQKLKLDAMVVQQGRLQSKDKLSKTDLIDALRFGAEKVFRANDDVVTDDDIDLILDRGKQKTEEIMNKLTDAEKGDMLDFKLDGGMKAQTFEGQDYSAEARRQQGPIIDKMLLLEEECSQQRVRKPANYSEKNLGALDPTTTVDQVTKKNKKPRSKLPEQLRIPHMHPWMFFEQDRLHEIAVQEETKFLSITQAADENPSTAEKLSHISTSMLVGADLAAEKEKLLGEGFQRWQRVHFSSFLKASARWGRSDFAAIAKEVGSITNEAEVSRYSKIFWDRGPLVFDDNEWSRMVRNIEKGEKKLEETCRVSTATRQVVERFADPWQELSLSYGQGRPATKEFTPAEDRCLLCLADTFGFGNWNKVKQELYRINAVQPDVFLDYFLLSATEESIGKRCEYLMRLAERDVTELEKKAELETHDSTFVHQNAAFEKVSAEADVRQHLIADLLLKRSTEQGKVLEGRLLEQALNEEQSGVRLEGLRERAQAAGLVANVREVSVPLPKNARLGSDCGRTTVSGAELLGKSKGKGSSVKKFPDDLVEPLIEFVIAQKSMGVERVTTAFKDVHSERELTKRCIDDKIRDFLVKDKRNSEKQERWRRREEHEKVDEAHDTGQVLCHRPTGSEPVSEKRKSSPQSQSIPKKPKGDKPGTGKKRKTSDSAPPRAVEDSASPNDPVGLAMSSSTSSSREKGPSKAKTPFQFFSSQNKPGVRSSLREVDPDVNEQQIKEELRRRWELLTSAEKSPFEVLAEQDRIRYKREVKNYQDRRLEKEREANSVLLPKKSKKEEAGPAETHALIPKKNPGSEDHDAGSTNLPPSPSRLSIGIPKKKSTKIHLEVGGNDGTGMTTAAKSTMKSTS